MTPPLLTSWYQSPEGRNYRVYWDINSHNGVMYEEDCYFGEYQETSLAWLTNNFYKETECPLSKL